MCFWKIFGRNEITKAKELGVIQGQTTRLRYWRTIGLNQVQAKPRSQFSIFSPITWTQFWTLPFLVSGRPWPWWFDWFMRCWLKTANNDKLRFWSSSQKQQHLITQWLWRVSEEKERRKVLRTILARAHWVDRWWIQTSVRRTRHPKNWHYSDYQKLEREEENEVRER